MARPPIIDTPSPGDVQGRTIAEVILAHVRIGVPFSDACLLAGTKPTTGDEWLARGRATGRRDDPTGRYAAFAGAVEEARAESRARAVAAIREAFQGVPEETTVTTRKPIRMADGTIQYVEEVKVTRGRRVYWQAGAWLLERTATEIFGRSRVWKDAEVPGGLPDPAVGDEADDAFEAAWDAYQKGRRDERDAPVVVEDPGANGASSV